MYLLSVRSWLICAFVFCLLMSRTSCHGAWKTVFCPLVSRIRESCVFFLGQKVWLVYYCVTRSSMLYINVVSHNHISTIPSLLSSSLWKQSHHRKLYNTIASHFSFVETISSSLIYSPSPLFILNSQSHRTHYNTNLTQTLQHPSLLYSPSLFLFTK